ncbi:MAG: hypothetical protein AB7H97_05305 [Pseudobdellovibrionaceae bacterium]
MVLQRPIWFFLGRFVFSLLVLLFVLTLNNANAEAPSVQNCEVTPAFSQTVHNTLQFREVEMISRNHDIGLYRGGPLALTSWIEVEPGAYLGVDREGRVLNVVQLPDRTIAFLLSGRRKIKDLFLKPPSDLFALDSNNELLRFNRPHWNKSVLPAIVKRGIKNYVGAMCAVGAGVATMSWFGLSLWRPEILMAIGMGSSGSFMLETFRAMVSFEHHNENTDGFDFINRRVDGWKQSEYEWDNQGYVKDYVLRGAKGNQQLSGLIDDFVTGNITPDFNRKCEYSVLARGIPPEEYEPQLK